MATSGFVLLSVAPTVAIFARRRPFGQHGTMSKNGRSRSQNQASHSTDASRHATEVATPRAGGVTGLSVSRLCHLFNNQPRGLPEGGKAREGQRPFGNIGLQRRMASAHAGFDHVGRFIGDFRKVYGVTPSAHHPARVELERST
jgi:hypothetical protein